MVNSRASRAGTCISGGALAAVMLIGCGGTGTFKNQPRAAVPLQLTGVVSDKQVTISPNRIGGGPIRLVIANETSQAHTITLERSGNEGEPNRDVVGPVPPQTAATLQQDLTQGQYSVTVDSSPNSIQPGTIDVGPKRNGSSGTLLLP